MSPLRLASIVIVMITGVVLITQVLIPTIDGGRADEWQFDDYRPVSDLGNVTGASGSLELVILGDVQYVHAKAIGAGTIERTGVPLETVYVQKADLDVFMMTGQSNAGYYHATPAEADPRPLPGTGYYFGTETQPISELDYDRTECAMRDMTKNGTVLIGDKGPAFAATYFADVGHKVYYITAGIGDKAVSGFVPPRGVMWLHMQAVVSDALSAIDETKFDVNVYYYMWIQGEGDQGTSAEAYKIRFLAMHDAIIAGGLGAEFSKCLIAKVRTINGATASQAQIELAEEYPDTIVMATELSDTFTVENGLMRSDDLHYSQKGDNLIGVALAECAASYAMPTEDSAVRDLLNVIPLLLIVGIIIAVVAEVVINRAG